MVVSLPLSFPVGSANQGHDAGLNGVGQGRPGLRNQLQAGVRLRVFRTLPAHRNAGGTAGGCTPTVVTRLFFNCLRRVSSVFGTGGWGFEPLRVRQCARPQSLAPKRAYVWLAAFLVVATCCTRSLGFVLQLVGTLVGVAIRALDRSHRRQAPSSCKNASLS